MSTAQKYIENRLKNFREVEIDGKLPVKELGDYVLIRSEYGNAILTVEGKPCTWYTVYEKKTREFRTMIRLAKLGDTLEEAMGRVKNWVGYTQGCVAKLKEAFTTGAFGDQSIVFVYDTVIEGSPLSVWTSRHENKAQMTHMTEEKIIDILGQYYITITKGYHHDRDVAQIPSSLVNIMIDGRPKVKVVPGIIDAVKENDLQNLDTPFHALGDFISVAMSGSPETFSERIHTFAHELSTNKHVKSILELYSKFIDPFIMDLYDDSLRYGNNADELLLKYAEGSRFNELLIKLGYVTSLPEQDGGGAWAESSDLYIIQLFRDYLYNQVDAEGRPLLEVTHVLSALSKLDAGSSEKIVLVSRDDRNCIIVSYEEIKKTIMRVFQAIS